MSLRFLIPGVLTLLILRRVVSCSEDENGYCVMFD